LRVVTVIGTRPQYIKSAPVSRALAAAGIDEVLVDTGQHYDRELSSYFFRADLRLPHMRTLSLKTSDTNVMRDAIHPVLDEIKPDFVLVYGDTNSAAAAVQAARSGSRRYPVVHVEAGARSGVFAMVEERNRFYIDHASDILFASCPSHADQLRAERVRGEVFVVGDVMRDVHKAITVSMQPEQHEAQRFLVTLHRRENQDFRRLTRIMSALHLLDHRILLPLHPSTRQAIDRHRIRLPETATILEPANYAQFQVLLRTSRALITDSGGAQKEAFWSRIPCITTRPSTEWTETVDLEANVIVDDDPSRILSASRNAHFPPMDDKYLDVYGTGDAAKRIAEVLQTYA